jgi:hypothetical protein
MSQEDDDIIKRRHQEDDEVAARLHRAADRRVIKIDIGPPLSEAAAHAVVKAFRNRMRRRPFIDPGDDFYIPRA